MKKVHLPISKNYVSHWGFWEGMRELLQNAVDTGDYQIKKRSLKGQVTITSNGGFLDLSTLMMGESTKRDDDGSIGQYGEGYKLAMLVLCRAGHHVMVYNGPEVWKVSIETHPDLGCEGLCVSISDNCTNDTEQLSFVVSGVSEDDFKILSDKFICEEGLKGDIVAEHNGSFAFQDFTEEKRVFVGGLYVCDLPESDSYWYSYNFAPNILSLDRDRSAVDSFYLQLEATKLIANSGNTELLCDMAADGATDISDYYTAPYSFESQESGTSLQDIALSSFIKQHGDSAYPINNQFESKKAQALIVRCVNAGMVPVTVKASFYKMLPSEIKDAIKIQPIKTDISKMLEEYISENKKHMRSKARKELVKIIDILQINGK